MRRHPMSHITIDLGKFLGQHNERLRHEGAVVEKVAVALGQKDHEQISGPTQH
jgi:hypothetical protein